MHQHIITFAQKDNIWYRHIHYLLLNVTQRVAARSNQQTDKVDLRVWILWNVNSVTDSNERRPAYRQWRHIPVSVSRDVTRLALGGLKPPKWCHSPPPNADGIPSKSYIYLYIIGLSSLLLNMIFQAQIVSKSMAAGALPQTPLGPGELTALPQTD